MLTTSHPTDPESHDWNLFDDAYRKQLDQRQYVSPSRDCKTTQASGSADGDPTPSPLPPRPSDESSKVPDTTKSRAQTFSDDQDLELDEAGSDEEDAEIPEGSLFEYNIPGVLSKEDVEKLDLGHWRLVVRDALIELEVRSNSSLLLLNVLTMTRTFVVGRSGQLMILVL